MPANQVIGWSYDAAGNLLNDGTTSYTYDALNRAITTGSTTNVYNADGVLVQQGSTRYVQDLAAPLSQILGDGTNTYIYDQDRLFAQQGSARTWYAPDALGSVRQTLSDSGVATGSIRYDPWGQIQGGTAPTFGFTGELQQGANVYLRARWYNAQRGMFSSRDPFVGWPEQPSSLMPYQYAYSDPVLLTDPSGKCLGWIWGDPNCQFAGTDYTKYDYAGASQVVVTGLGVAATVVACAGTAGAVCVAGAAGAAGVTSWGNQALDNAGQPVAQAVTNVSLGQIGVEAGLAALSGPIGGVAGRVTTAVTARVGMSATLRATLNGSAIGAISSGTDQALRNLWDGNALWDGVPEACLFGGLVGGLTGRFTNHTNVPASVQSGIVRLNRPGFLLFEGLEVRGVRDLSHLSEGTLRAMQARGFAATDTNGDRIILHHLYQNPEGPLVEIPAPRHRISNRVQHPYGNMEGMGLTDEERRLFNEWRTRYWQARATEELARRGIK